jgi:hypothetical protein
VDHGHGDRHHVRRLLSAAFFPARPDLHPLDEAGRIRRALERLGGGAEYLGTGADGVVRVRLEGCRSGAGAVEAVVRDAAPETTAVVVAAGTPLVQIGMGPPPGWRPAAPPEGRAS